jgi:hypothetical protein
MKFLVAPPISLRSRINSPWDCDARSGQRAQRARRVTRGTTERHGKNVPATTFRRPTCVSFGCATHFASASRFRPCFVPDFVRMPLKLRQTRPAFSRMRLRTLQTVGLTWSGKTRRPGGGPPDAKCWQSRQLIVASSYYLRSCDFNVVCQVIVLGWHTTPWQGHIRSERAGTSHAKLCRRCFVENRTIGDRAAHAAQRSKRCCTVRNRFLRCAACAARTRFRPFSTEHVAANSFGRIQIEIKSPGCGVLDDLH